MKRTPYFVLFLLLAVAVSSRFVNIGTQGIMVDETWVVPGTIFHFEDESIFPKLFSYPQYLALSPKKQEIIKSIYNLHPLGQIALLHATSDLHPPLFFFGNYFWSRWFGYSEAAIRSPAAIFFILTIFVLFWFLKKQNIEWPTKFVILSFTVFSPILLFFSNFARPYTLLVLFSTLSSFLAYEMVRTNFKNSVIVWYIVSAVAALYTHYYALLVVLSQFAYLFMERAVIERKSKDIWKIMAIGSVVMLVFAPTVAAVLVKVVHSGASSGKPLFSYLHWNELWLLILSFGFAYSETTVSSYLNVIISLLQVVLFLCGALYLWTNRKEHHSRYWLFFFFAPFTLIVMLNLWKPVFTVRNCLVVLIPYLAVSAFGLCSIRKKAWKAAILGFIVVTGLFSVYYGLAHGNLKGAGGLEDWRSTSQFVAKLDPEVPVYVYQPSYRDALNYYIQDEDRVKGFPYTLSGEGLQEAKYILVIVRPEDSSYRIEEKIEAELPFLTDMDKYDVRFLSKFPRIFVYEVERKPSKG